MTHLAKITAVEARLLLREPGTWIVGLLLPAFVLVVIGLIFGPHETGAGARRPALHRPAGTVDGRHQPGDAGDQHDAGASRRVPGAGRPAPAVHHPGRAAPPC